MREIFQALAKLIGCLLAFLIGTLLSWFGVLCVGFGLESSGMGTLGIAGIMIPCFLMGIYTTELLWYRYVSPKK